MSVYFYVYLVPVMSAHAVLLIPFKAAWLKHDFRKALCGFDEFTTEDTSKMASLNV